MLITQTTRGLKHPKAQKVQDFFLQLRREFLRLHPKDGPARVAAYQGATQRIMAEIQRLPADEQKKIYEYIDKTVIKPVGKTLDPGEVDATVKRLRTAITQLSEKLGVPLPTNPATMRRGLRPGSAPPFPIQGSGGAVAQALQGLPPDLANIVQNAIRAGRRGGNDPRQGLVDQLSIEQRLASLQGNR